LIVIVTTCYSGNHIKKNAIEGGGVARMGGRRGAYRVLVWKPEGKRQLKDLGVDGR